jgi:hypothetical protein
LASAYSPLVRTVIYLDRLAQMLQVDHPVEGIEALWAVRF